MILLNNATQLTFGITQVIEIVMAVVAAVGVFYALKRSAEKNSDRIEACKKEMDDYKKEINEKFIHAKNSKKANIQMIMEKIKENREEVTKKEDAIYRRIIEVRDEQKDAHEKLSGKIDGVVIMQQTMNTAIAELTGYLKAQGKIRPKD